MIVFDDIIADILDNKKLNLIATELSIRGKKISNSFVFILQCCFAVPNIIRLNSTHCFIMKISNKQEFQKTAFNHSSDIDFQEFMKLSKRHMARPYSYLGIDDTPASDNPSERIFHERIFQQNIKTNHGK